MQKEVPPSVVYGSIGVLAIALIVVGFFVFVDKKPTKEVNMVGREQLKGRPAPQAPPAWVLEKTKHGGQ